MPLSNFVPRGFGFVYHSIAFLCHEVPNPNITIRNFFVGPKEWTILAKMLHSNRSKYDAFLVIHGTDTMAYTASALSLMLSGFGKPIIMTGSQLPLLMPRSDARQNLIDSITCATAGSSHPYIHLSELAVCFGGHLIRGNRCGSLLHLPSPALLPSGTLWRSRADGGMHSAPLAGHNPRDERGAHTLGLDR